MRRTTYGYFHNCSVPLVQWKQYQPNHNTIQYIYHQMNKKEPSELTDQELLDADKKIKSNPITDAVLIGFLVGIIIFSVVKNTWGLVTLLPLFLIYIFLKKGKNKKGLQEELKKRKLM